MDALIRFITTDLTRYTQYITVKENPVEVRVISSNSESLKLD